MPQKNAKAKPRELAPHEYDYSKEKPYVGGFPYAEEITPEVYKHYKETSDEATWAAIGPLFDEAVSKKPRGASSIEQAPNSGESVSVPTVASTASEQAQATGETEDEKKPQTKTHKTGD